VTVFLQVDLVEPKAGLLATAVALDDLLKQVAKDTTPPGA
jgi:hypothetical protein